MATSNEDIRDALIKRQIQLIQQSGAASREIIKLLEDAHADLRERIDARLKKIVDTGETTTKRLLALERNIAAILGRAYRKIDRRLREIMQDIGIDDPKIVASIMKDALPVVMSFTVPSAAQLKGIIETMVVDGTPLNQIMGRLSDIVTDGIMTSVRRGLAQGEGIQAIASRIRKQFDLTRARANAIVRTAANTAAHHARGELFRKNARLIKFVVWTATLDDRTCPQCGALDGRRFKVDKGPRPPIHVSCRCAAVPSIDGTLIGERPLKKATLEDLLREYTEQAGIKRVKSRGALPRGHKGQFDKFARKRTRQLTGRTPASVTFDEFLRKQSPAFQNKVLREQVATWYRQRKLDLEDLFDTNGDIFSIDELLRRHPDLRDTA